MVAQGGTGQKLLGYVEGLPCPTTPGITHLFSVWGSTGIQDVSGLVSPETEFRVCGCQDILGGTDGR